MTTVSEPPKGGIDRKTDGGATAPMQKAEQALQVEWAELTDEAVSSATAVESDVALAW